MVRADLHLEAIVREAAGDGHHAGVVDEEVQATAMGGRPLLGECSDRREAGEIELIDLDGGLGVGAAYLGSGFLTLADIAHRHRHLGSAPGQRLRSLVAEA